MASVDHVNAPLLWDKGTAAAFSWLYQELTTYIPYCVETARIQPLLTADRHSTSQASFPPQPHFPIFPAIVME